MRATIRSYERLASSNTTTTTNKHLESSKTIQTEIQAIKRLIRNTSSNYESWIRKPDENDNWVERVIWVLCKQSISNTKYSSRSSAQWRSINNDEAKQQLEISHEMITANIVFEWKKHRNRNWKKKTRSSLHKVLFYNKTLCKIGTDFYSRSNPKGLKIYFGPQ